MASAAELEFILKMRDEASAILKQHQAVLNQTAQATQGLARSNIELAKAAKEAATTIVAAFTTQHVFREAIAEARQYGEHLRDLAVASGTSGDALLDLESRIERVNSKMDGVPLDKIRQFGIIAADSGYKGGKAFETFTETTSKLFDAFKLSDGAAQSFGQLMKATGAGAKDMESFGDALAVIKGRSTASADELINLTSVMQGQTSQYDINAKQLLALAGTFSNMHLPVRQLSMVFSQTMRSISESSTASLERFAKSAGMTREQLQQLIQTDPAAAFVKFTEVVDQLNRSGVGATGFLKEFNLEGVMSERVLSALAKKSGEMKANMAAAQGNNAGALAKDAGGPENELSKAYIELKKAWDEFYLDIGTGIGPAVAVVVRDLTSILKWFHSTFDSLSESSKQWMAWGTIAAGAAVTVASALGTLMKFAALGDILTGLLTPLKLLWTAFRVLGAPLVFISEFVIGFAVEFATMIAGAIAAIGAVPIAIAAAVVLILASIYEVYQHWADLVAFFKQPWSEIFGQIGKIIEDAFYAAIARVTTMWDDFTSWLSGDDSARLKPQLDDAEFKKQMAGLSNMLPNADLTKQPGDAQFQKEGGFKLGKPTPAQALGLKDEDLKLVSEFNSQAEAAKKLTDQLTALEAIAGGTDAQLADANWSRADLQNAKDQVALAQQRLKPLYDIKRSIADQLDDTQAVTGAMKNQLEIARAIRDENEKRTLTPAQKDEITSGMQASQAAKIKADLDERIHQLGLETQMLGASTAAEKARLSITQQVEEFKRQTGASDAQAAQFQAGLEAKRTAELQAQWRDKMKGMQQSIDAARLTGEHADADRQALTDLNAMKEQGLVTDQNSAAVMQSLTTYYREMAQAAKEHNQGIEGWMNGVQSLHDGLMEVEKDFTTTLSDGITNAITGGASSWKQSLADIGKKMIGLGVNNLMKQAMQGLGLGNESQPHVDAAQAALQKLQSLSGSISTPVANIQAGVVNVGGSIVPAGIGATGSQAFGPAANSNVAGGSGYTGPFGPGLGFGTPANSNVARSPGYTGAFGPGLGFGSNAVSSVQSGAAARTLALSAQDITDMKKTLMTEWVPSAGKAQAAGITDTMLNREASGHWGNTMHDVVNARSQFSAINGGPAWGVGRTSVDQIPDSTLLSGKGLQASKFTDAYLAQRMAGQRSSVGDNLNYANPYYSDAKNRSWIDKLDGPTLGSGMAIHRHGTTADLQQYRPGEFNVAGPAGTGGLQIQPAAVQLQQQKAAVSQLTTTWQKDMTHANTAIAGQMPQAFQAPITKIGADLTKGIDATPIKSLSPAISGLGQTALAAIPGLKGFGGTIMSVVQQLLSSLGGAGGGLGSILGALFHTGGEVGTATTMRQVPIGAFAGAQRFHTGLKNDEFPAILQRGERVLTADQNKQTTSMMNDMMAAVERAGQANADKGRYGTKNVNQSVVNNIYAKDADSFRRADGQVMSDTHVRMARMASRNG